MATTQYQDFVAAVDHSVESGGVQIVPGATMGSRLAFRVPLPGMDVFLSADKRITKVVLADGKAIVKPKPDQRAEIFAQIAVAVKRNAEVAA